MLYFVFLRRPRDKADMRSDPFWEFGSFGRTGCHDKNLLHPKNSPLRDGDRLVFLQGGDQEIRAVGLTPPIAISGDSHRLDLRWDSSYRPVPFETAPVLIDNQGYTDFPAVLDALANTQRSTYCGKAGSRLRARTTPIEGKLADQISSLFGQPGQPKISHYLEAIAEKGSAWFRHGFHSGWADHGMRSQRFEELGSTEPLTPGSRASKIQKRRSRC